MHLNYNPMHRAIKTAFLGICAYEINGTYCISEYRKHIFAIYTVYITAFKQQQLAAAASAYLVSISTMAPGESFLIFSQQIIETAA